MATKPRIIKPLHDCPLSSLHPNERNPRFIVEERFEALKKALDADPLMLQARPVVALKDGTIIAGNMRWRAAEALGWATIPAVVVALDEQTATAWMLRDNQEYGAWDEQALAEMLYELSQTEMDMSLAGFDDAELTRLLMSVSGPEGKDPDDVPPLPEGEPRSKLGEVYELGPHRLMCGDATTDLPALMGDIEADCIWTDPPYGVEYVGKTKAALTIANDGLAANALVRDVFLAAQAFVVDSAPFYCAGPPGPLSLNYQLAIVAAGFRLHEELVWVKDVFVLGHSDYHYQHEPIFYGYAPGSGRPGRGRHEGTRWYGDHAQTSVLEVPRPKRSEEHPTMKPVDLIVRCIANSTPTGGIVLDPFAGSGTTMIAADQLGRRAFLMEIDPRYCDVIRDRYERWIAS